MSDQSDGQRSTRDEAPGGVEWFPDPEVKGRHEDLPPPPRGVTSTNSPPDGSPPDGSPPAELPPAPRSRVRRADPGPVPEIVLPAAFEPMETTMTVPGKPRPHRHEWLDFLELAEQQLRHLTRDAEHHAREARRERMMSWVFKVPAILGVVAVIPFQAMHVGIAVLLAAMTSAVSSSIDAARPRGLLGIHRMAASESRRVATRLQSEWQLIEVECGGDVEQARSRVAALIRLAEQERAAIDGHVAAAGASLGRRARG